MIAYHVIVFQAIFSILTLKSKLKYTIIVLNYYLVRGCSCELRNERKSDANPTVIKDAL